MAARVGPRAARTIKAVLLVQSKKRPRAANQPHLARGVLRRLPHGGQSARDALRVSELAARELLRRLRAHAAARFVLNFKRAVSNFDSARPARVRLVLHARVVVRRLRGGSLLSRARARPFVVAPRLSLIAHRLCSE